LGSGFRASSEKKLVNAFAASFLIDLLVEAVAKKSVRAEVELVVATE
jgi:hypothetical protein